MCFFKGRKKKDSEHSSFPAAPWPFFGAVCGACVHTSEHRTRGGVVPVPFTPLPALSLMRRFIFTRNRCDPLTSTAPGRGLHDDTKPHQSRPAPFVLKVQHAPTRGSTSLRDACLPSFLPGHSLQGSDISFPRRLAASCTGLSPWRPAEKATAACSGP